MDDGDNTPLAKLDKKADRICSLRHKNIEKMKKSGML